jgi:hypothetical protein
MRRDCGHCALATTVRNGRPDELVCASVAGYEGVLSRVEAGEGCRCFKAKPTPPLRLEPPEPPNDEIRYIPLTRGLFAIVDAADYDWLSGFKWRATTGRKPYACFARTDNVIYMHRLIMNPPKGLFVDHVNGNSLDYRRSDLRNCTKAQNAWNQPALGGTSRFKGVHRDQNGKWKAAIRVGGSANLHRLVRRRGQGGQSLRPDGPGAVRRFRVFELPERPGRVAGREDLRA